MNMVSIADAPSYDEERFVAAALLDGTQSNVRLIRLSPGQTLPPHPRSVGSDDLHRRDPTSDCGYSRSARNGHGCARSAAC